MDKTLSIVFTFPMNSYLEQELSNRYNLIKLYEIPIQKKPEFLKTHSQSIRAIVADRNNGADAEMIEMLPKLEIVASYSVGLDKIDLQKCKEKGINVTNTPDVLTDDVARDGSMVKGSWATARVSSPGCFEFLAPSLDVADLAIGLTISVMRRICEADRYVRSGSWKLKSDFKLTSKFSGKRVGIVGLGRIGRAIATRVEAFDCPIGYYSKTPKPNSYKYYPTVLELASNSDILIVACSLTSETHHIINKEVINALGPKGVLINIGRGLHVDEPELVNALLEGRLGGAGLDVFEDEPHVPEELLGLDNVVLSPHAASGTLETRKVMADLVLGNLEAHFLKKPLLTPVV